MPSRDDTSQAEPAVVSCRHAGHICALRLAGAFDATDAQLLDEAIADSIDAGVRHFAVDLHRVSDADRATLDALLRARKRASRRNGALVLVRPPAPLWRMLVLTGIATAFPTFQSEQTALDHLARLRVERHDGAVAR